MIDPIRPTDDEARALARELLTGARHAALGVLEPGTGAPMVTRIAIGTDASGRPATLISSLSQHTAALQANPDCSVLIGEPGDKGDPLTHPRLTLQCRARLVARGAPEHAELRDRWLEQHPKAKLYIDFGDFGFAILEASRGFLNGGFGKAYLLAPRDLGMPAKG
ncbi:HugZ family protein [Tropicimonas sediminicola]|uniref:CREG-like beta-barrel domain-containing protein n=1 Tax=Tropicimonas sediminicola TaxID=1031541 RepID=A0A239LVJ8_9RHOB|nr:pyridoxamine 5'-phosphate oxidase family protein [Tropicimonas sediminicola]SNT33823.1 hypothetical protein SAMN05421757_11148 [Tropicimonas sediminicola]